MRVKVTKNTRYKNPQFVACNLIKIVARPVVSLMINEEQSQNWLLKVDLRSTFRNNFPQPTSKDQQTFLLHDKLIMQGEKRETSTQN